MHTRLFFSYPFLHLFWILHFHGYFVFVIPFTTHRNWQANNYGVIYILLQLFYVYYSAKQIQQGYSHFFFYSKAILIKQLAFWRRLRRILPNGVTSLIPFIQPFLSCMKSTLFWSGQPPELFWKWRSGSQSRRFTDCYIRLLLMYFCDRRVMNREKMGSQMMTSFSRSRVLQRRNCGMDS